MPSPKKLRPDSEMMASATPRLAATMMGPRALGKIWRNMTRPVFITVVLHRRIPYLINLVGQVAPKALPDAYETTQFLFRSDWPLAARGSASVKLNEMTNGGCRSPRRRRCNPCEPEASLHLFIKIDRIPQIFNLRSSIFISPPTADP